MRERENERILTNKSVFEQLLVQSPQRWYFLFRVLEQVKVLDKLIMIMLYKVVEVTQLQVKLSGGQQEVVEIICHRAVFRKLKIHEVRGAGLG